MKPPPTMHDWRLAPVAVAVWCGALFGTKTDSSAAITGVAGATSLGCVWMLASLNAVQPRQGRHNLIPFGSLRALLALVSFATVVAVCVGAVAHNSARRTEVFQAAQSGSLITIRGELEDDPSEVLGQFSSDSQIVSLRVTHAGKQSMRPTSPIKVRLTGSHWPTLYRGDTVETRGVIDTEFSAHLPWVGIIHTSKLKCVARPQGWRATVRRIRTGLVDLVADLEPQAQALVPGMAIGDDSAMTKELKEAFRRTSLSHLTAVSGSHLAIIMGVAALVLRGRTRFRLFGIAAILTIVVAIVGATPAVMRAVLTSALGIGAEFSGRGKQGVTTLSAVTIGSILFNPWVASNFGFSLSVAATFGVVVIARRLLDYRRRRIRSDTRIGKTIGFAIDYLAIPVSCYVMTFPVLLLANPRVPVYGIPANVMASVAVAPATLLALAATYLLGVSPWLAHACAQGSAFFTRWIANVALFFAHLPGASHQLSHRDVIVASIVSATLVFYWKRAFVISLLRRGQTHVYMERVRLIGRAKKGR